MFTVINYMYATTTEPVVYRQFPSYYYKLTFDIPSSDKTLDILVLDTIMLCGNSDDFQDQMPQGPVSSEKAETQWRWIQDNLQASK